jgi:uncharacterized protein
MAHILVVSDSHHNNLFLREAIRQVPNCDYIFHLGDYYEDLDDNIDLLTGKKTIKVPGINHPLYFRKKSAVIQVVRIENWDFAMAHTKMDLHKKKYPANFYLFGHTHHPSFFEESGIYHLNPGHLKKATDRGNEASYATIKVEENIVIVKLHHLYGNLFFEKTLSK